MTKMKRILHQLLDDIAGFFPYFFGFYIFSLVLSFVFHSWKSFFNWELFTISVIVLGIASLFSNKVWSLRDLISTLKYLFVALIGSWKRLGTRGQIKIVLILTVLFFALAKSIGPIDFIVLTYALASVLFIFKSRIPAVLALVLLAACPFLLMFKKDATAEVMAIYAYYFLVITVMTQIAEYIKEGKEADLSTGA